MKKTIYLCPMNGTGKMTNVEIESKIGEDVRAVIHAQINSQYESINKFCIEFNFPKSTVAAFLAGQNSKFDLFLKLLIALGIGFELKK